MGFITLAHFISKRQTTFPRADMKKFIYLMVVLHVSLHLFPKAGHAQGSAPVYWHFKVRQLPKHQVMVAITADLAPGWHLYSQHLKEGGPQPTRFSFRQSEDYMPVDETLEKGNPEKYYDDIYEMDITWYSGSVTFLQKFSMNEPVTTIKGHVAYMTCNDQLCVPAQTEFDIPITTK